MMRKGSWKHGTDGDAPQKRRRPSASWLKHTASTIWWISPEKHRNKSTDDDDGVRFRCAKMALAAVCGI